MLIAALHDEGDMEEEEDVRGDAVGVQLAVDHGKETTGGGRVAWWFTGIHVAVVHEEVEMKA